ncbi:MAG: GatB/YqeY domain-containing protein, partial [Gammaproteobacteria bacterium]|nr:GatB/YqeY domain-containing protein [Gammaproteobacteria bacterium]
ITLLQTYMPEQLAAAEVEALVVAAIAETSATTVKDMGKVMALVKTRAAGRADMGAVSNLIKSKLSAAG